MALWRAVRTTARRFPGIHAMLRRPISWQWHVTLGVLSFVALVTVYGYGAWSLNREDPGGYNVMPGWQRLYERGWVEVTTPDSKHNIKLLDDLEATFYRFFVGMAFSVLLAVPVGLLMGCFTAVEAFFQPLLGFLAKIPGTAMYGVFLVACSTDQIYPAMILFGIVPTLTLIIFQSAKVDVPEELLFKARTLGASQFSCVWDVIFRHAFPKVLEGIRLSVGPALIFLYAAELARGEDGIGCTIRLYGNKGVVGAPVTYLYIVLAALIALLFDAVLRGLQRFLCPWYVHASR
jgi:NitT/TauT family transport system permease protein